MSDEGVWGVVDGDLGGGLEGAEGGAEVSPDFIGRFFGAGEGFGFGDCAEVYVDFGEVVIGDGVRVFHVFFCSS